MPARTLIAATLLSLLALAGCNISAHAADDLPVAAWDFHPEGEVWTEASLTMLASDAAVLTELEPADIGAWCPGYSGASTEERAAFWTGLLSALAEHESTWNPQAVGGGGRWFGLVQISPATARLYRSRDRGQSGRGTWQWQRFRGGRRTT